MSTPQSETGIRLQKVMAAAGVGSRRACEELIAKGRVSVDGATVREQGMRVDPDVAVVRVDDMRINTGTNRAYLAMNKPRGMVSAMTDPDGRPTVGDLVEQRTDRVFHVGRLDADSEGLLLLTNDGELSHRLTHPSYEIPKTYLAEVIGPVARDVGKRLKAGIELEDGLAKVDGFRLTGSSGNRVMMEVVLHDGRKHIVRRMLESVGHPVERLVRTQVGPIHLGDQRAGKIRNLNSAELSALFAAVGM